MQKEPICTARGGSRASVAFRGAFSCACRQCSLCKPREVSDDEYDAGESWVPRTRRAAGDHDKDQWRVEADQANVMMKQILC